MRVAPLFTVFLAALLLFSVQLMLGKRILPWFGGTPAVWTTCMLFFQLALLAGYAYAHALARWKQPGRQPWLHGALVIGSLGWLGFWALRWEVPLLAADSWKPLASGSPQGQILLLLCVGVGPPFLVLAATSPLLQHWAGRAASGESIWRLYAVSNAGSLIGLIAYPLLVERLLPLSSQAWCWAAGFVLFAVGILVCGAQATAAPSVEEAKDTVDSRIGAGRLLTWILLAASASAMLLAVTNELCQEVAPVPFLWMLPLLLYLLSFILCFDSPRWYARRFFTVATAATTIVVLVTDLLSLRLAVPVQVLSFGAFLFCFCMTCHGELVRLRPATSRLTLFYLTVASGGALGGIFVGFVAPRIFDSYWEFNIMVTVAWSVLAIVFLADRRSPFHTGDWWHFALSLGLLGYVAIRIASLATERQLASGAASLAVAAAVALGPAWLGAWLLRRRRFASSALWPRILFGTVVFLAACFMVVRMRTIGPRTVAAGRNFFGTLRVERLAAVGEGAPSFLRLTHGRVNHGIQYEHERFGRVPVSYYGPGSGAELAVLRHPRRLAQSGEGLHIGVIGLGAGVMAAYGEPGDRVRFYEINPLVLDYAGESGSWFRYVRDASCPVEIVEGDARLSMERELRRGEEQRFDILVMDAFSSDSVPVHLLTREAFELYAAHLRDEDSVIVVNITNRFLDFSSLVTNHATDLGLEARLVTQREQGPLRVPSLWMLLTRSARFLTDETVTDGAAVVVPRDSTRWTDDYSALLPLIPSLRR